MSKENYNVTIIGCGLVGSLCACYLAKRGFNVNVYEKRKDIRSVPKQQGKSINLAMSFRALKALRRVDLDQEVLAKSVPMKGRLLHDLSGKCRFVPYDITEQNCLYSISRNILNEIIVSAAEKMTNVKLYYDHELVDADLTSGMLVLKNQHQETFRVRSDFIIGSDGAHSTLRTMMQRTPMFSTAQTYIEHGYVELSINPNLGKMLARNYLHIWPREKFMMIALPNEDESWTVTLFMPFEHFDDLDREGRNVSTFLSAMFPDAAVLLERQFTKLKPRSLMTVSCDPFHAGDRTLLIGDAAHAMVPFYGQGMNAGFEDCIILDDVIDRCGDDVTAVVREFTKARKDDAHAICELSMYNYREMRELVLKTSYHLRKKIDDFLYKRISRRWIPLYTSVTFTDIPYRKCMENRQWQDRVLRNMFCGILILVLMVVLKFFY